MFYSLMGLTQSSRGEDFEKIPNNLVEQDLYQKIPACLMFAYQLDRRH